ncbi:MAG: hypothetical protein IJ812_02600 [Schwartzia sp.]|nr:hypothetical protein [Schwartzia sp. (in: firmicutes)]
MANTIGSHYATYQKTMGQVGGAKRPAGKKAAEDGKKPFGGFGDDFGVQLSEEGLAALAAQRKQETENEENGETSLISEDKLSDKAKDFLAKLREKYGDKYDFFAVSSIEDPRARELTGTKAYSVLLTNDEIEKMANDEKYAEEVMQRVESAVDMTKRIQEKGELGDGVQFKHISISFDSDGNMKLFAELEKMSDQQRERMEKLKEKRAEEKEEAERAKDKDDGEDGPGAKRVRLEATSEEELLEKILGIDWDKIPAAGEKKAEEDGE